jgi:NADH pyrophosphatase NudC (nudix superfamily)
MDEGESLIQAVEREVREETGYIVQAKQLLGAYSSTYKDDLVLSIEAEIVDRDDWQPNQEISEIGFFAREELPQPMNLGTTARILDAFNKEVGVMRVLTSK